MARAQHSSLAVMTWAFDNLGVDPETLVSDDAAFEKALEAYLKANEETPEVKPGEASVKLLVAVVNGNPVCGYRYTSQRGRSTLKMEIEESLSMDSRVRVAELRSGQEADIRDLSARDQELISLAGRSEWTSFLAVEHPIKVKADTKG